jgi:FkbM family methyltransferase
MRISHLLRASRHRLGLLRHLARTFGTTNALRIFRSLYVSKQSPTTLIRLSKKIIGSHIYLRFGTSDIEAFEKIFVWRQYALPTTITFRDNKAKLIIDGGANIGLSAIWFAQQCPEAKVIALEPDSANYEILLKNTAPFPNIIPILGGVWNRCCSLVCQNRAVRPDSFQFIECDNEAIDAIRAYDISQILQDYGDQEIDILKLDVEGAEEMIFSENYNGWLDYINLLFIEFHGSKARDKVERVMHDAGYEQSRSGENDVFMRPVGNRFD